jgi:catechol 2,3-dioxygenase-like lactoylglutathione lyase family enzyme
MGLGSSRLIGFVPTRDAERTKGFFEEKLGLKFVSGDKFALVFESNGSQLRVVRVGEFQPLPFTILGWEVEDIAASVRELSGAGVSFERYTFIQQNELGIWDAPGGARVAWFKDPDGNVLSISQQQGADFRQES